MIFVCSHAAPARGGEAAGVLNGIEYVEVRDTRRADDSRCASARSSCGCCCPCRRRSTAANVVIDGGERIGTVPVEWATAGTALPATLSAAEQADAARRPRCARPRPRRAHRRSAATSRATASPSSPVPAATHRRPASTRCSSRSTSPSRSSARATSTAARVHLPAGRAHRATDRLPRQGLRRLPPADARADGAARAGLDRTQPRRPRHRPWSSCSPTSPTSSPTGRTRSPPRPTSTPRASRVSLRRHARLVDYRMHEGCNARAWVQVAVDGPGRRAAGAARTAARRFPACRRGSNRSRRTTTPPSPRRRSSSRRWTTPCWTATSTSSASTPGASRAAACRAGATSATLRGQHPNLRAGDVLVLAERSRRRPAPRPTPTRRVAGRCGSPTCARSTDPSGGLFHDPPTTPPSTSPRSSWEPADALPFPLCVSVVDGDRVVSDGLGQHRARRPRRDDRRRDAARRSRRRSTWCASATAAIATTAPARRSGPVPPGAAQRR